MQTTIVHYATLREVGPGTPRVHYLLVVARDAGYRCVTHYGEVGEPLRTLHITHSDVQYSVAKRVFDVAVKEKLASGTFTAELGSDPLEALSQIAAYGSDVRVLDPDEVTDYRTSRITRRVEDRRQDLLQQERRNPNLATRGYINLIMRALRDDAGEIRYRTHRAVDLTKTGGTVEIPGDLSAEERALCLNVARTIGGTFVMRGCIEGARFLYARDALVSTLRDRLDHIASPLIGPLTFNTREAKRDALRRFLDDLDPENLLLSIPGSGSVDVRAQMRDALRPDIASLIDGDQT